METVASAADYSLIKVNQSTRNTLMISKEGKEFVIPKEKSWHFGALMPEGKSQSNYMLLEPAVSDITKVVNAYAHHPVEGYNMVQIDVVYNGNLNRLFKGHMSKLNARERNEKYNKPSWPVKTIGEEKQHREETYQQLLTLAEPWSDDQFPHVKILPLWHGTNDQIAQEYIFDAGYGIFTSNDPSVKTDPGFFGVGVYTTHEAEYAFRVYAEKYSDEAVLLLNWVSIFKAYPVIGAEGLKFQGTTAGQDECDAHFIPVYAGHHPTDFYYPCYPHQKAQYHEVVVFNEDQALPRYRVKLAKNKPQLDLGHQRVSDDYQRALDNLACYRYGKVASAWEEAYHADDVAALIRLHWWYSGASSVYSANPQALAMLQPVQPNLVEALKRKAHFRADNDAESQFTLGWCYQQGLGCDIHLAKAAQYYWIAAAQGHREAQYQLGACCAAGIGVKVDMSQAIIYYEQAAKQGQGHAHYLLFQCYEWGLGVPENAVKASMHQQAARKGKHPQLMGAGLASSPDVMVPPMQLEQKIKQLEQQIT